MNIHVTFKHMHSTEALKSHTNEKTGRLEKFLGRDFECSWVLFVEHDEHVAELRVKGPHIDQFAQAKSEDMYRSIDDCVDKLEKQLRKHKEIVKDHLHRKREEPSGLSPDSDEADEG